MFGNKFWRVAIAMLIPLLGSVVFNIAAEDSKEDDAKLFAAIPASKLTLIAGIDQATKLPEAAISAKFELEDGKLSLSVYTAEKGLSVSAEHNVLKELAGSPLAAKWTPEIEIFKDAEHVSRASEQLALMALSKLTLADVVKKADQDQPGMLWYSIAPTLQNRKAVFVVLGTKNSQGVELRYDLMTGEKLSPAKK